MNVETKVEICTKLNIMSEAQSAKYLGLPAMVRVDRSVSFIHLLERIINRLKSWKEKSLSMGGKEILLKVVILSILVFLLCPFLISQRNFARK